MSAVARRYAKALFALAQEHRQQEAVARELDAVAELVQDPQVAIAWNNPLLTAPERRQLTAALRERLGMSDLFGNFLEYLAEHKRLQELPAIRDHYERLLDDAAHRTRARIASAMPLAPEHLQEIVELLQRQTGKSVLATTATDPALVGGFVVEIEGKVYDASVANQLASLAHRLGGGASH
ncbi:MAG: ATP synthase subunit delta [Candidatus Binatia bacterium]|nr:MAG: ATP synthase subunit delta [Candidatus Binatia bacterium]